MLYYAILRYCQNYVEHKCVQIAASADEKPMPKTRFPTSRQVKPAMASNGQHDSCTDFCSSDGAQNIGKKTLGFDFLIFFDM